MTPRVLEGIRPLTVFGCRPSTRPIIMSTMVLIYGLNYDPFPGGHYIHPFHEKTHGYLEDEGEEHPRTVRFP